MNVSIRNLDGNQNDIGYLDSDGKHDGELISVDDVIDICTQSIPSCFVV